MKIKLKELAIIIEGKLDGNGDIIITGAAGLEEAGANEISFLGNPKYGRLVPATKAGAVIVPEAF